MSRNPGKEERNHPAFEYGTDAQYLEWVSYQRSVIDGGWNQRNPDRNIPCHVRRLYFGAGLAIKPPFSAVPMTDRQHKIQSGTNGEAKVLRLRWPNKPLVSADFARHWFEDASDQTLARWIEYRKAIRK